MRKHHKWFLITPTNKGDDTPEESLFRIENSNKQKMKYDEITRHSFLSTRQLQTLTSTFLSKSELQEAVDDYCRDPDGWVNSAKYPIYG